MPLPVWGHVIEHGRANNAFSALIRTNSCLTFSKREVGKKHCCLSVY